jgi:hypothetical protein
LSANHYPTTTADVSSPPGVFPSTNKPLSRSSISNKQNITNHTSSFAETSNSNSNINNNSSSTNDTNSVTSNHQQASNKHSNEASNTHSNETYSPTRTLLNSSKPILPNYENSINNHYEVNNINIAKIEEVNQQLQEERLQHQQCISRLLGIENQLKIQVDRNNTLLEEKNELNNLKDDKEDELESVNDQLLFLRNQLLVKSGQVSELEILMNNKDDVELELRNELDIIRLQKSNENQYNSEMKENSTSNHTNEEYTIILDKVVDLEQKYRETIETCQKYKALSDDLLNENTLWGNK